MPVHDWTRVDAGIFHDFHHAWIEDIKRALNSGILPDEYYALAEQFAGGFGPDVLTLEGPPGDSREDADRADANVPGGGVLLASPPFASPARRTWRSTGASKTSWQCDM